MSTPKIASECNRRIFVGNIAYQTTEQELIAAIEGIGIHVFRARIVTHQDTGRSRGFAFVDIDRSDAKTVEEAITLVNQGTVVYGRSLHADKANLRTSGPKPEKPMPRPRGGRGKAASELAPLGNEFGGKDRW